MAISIRELLFDLGKIVEGAANTDFDQVVSYGNQLIARLQAAGESEGAKRLKEIIGQSKAQKFTLARANPPQSSAPAVPVDSESRLPVADEEYPKAGEVDLFLPKEQEEEIAGFLRIMKSAEKLLASGIKPSGTLLLHGPPGCGKTQVAKYVAAQLDMPLVTARADALISSYLGSTAKNIRYLFEYVGSRRCVLFLDEFDALGKMRDDARELGELKRVVIGLLQNIDRLGPEHLLIAATNHAHLLDPAIWRRFAHRLLLDVPDASLRRRMLAHFLRDYATSEQIEVFAASTPQLSGAILRQVSEDAIRMAVLAGEKTVNSPYVIDRILAGKGESEKLNDVSKKIVHLRGLDKSVFTQARLANLFRISQAKVSRILSRPEISNA